MTTRAKLPPGAGVAAALLSVAAVTVLIFGLRELVPVLSTGVVYMLAVLLVSSYADDTQVLRVHVANLRRKIEPDPGAPRYILTDPGIGYRFSG